MTRQELVNTYRAYIQCLNDQDWPNLGQFVHEDAVHNGRVLGLSGYRRMLENDYATIPDLHFNIALLIADPPYIASRLLFDCHPKDQFLGLTFEGKKVKFYEHVMYEFVETKIKSVQSVIDKHGLEIQLR